MLLPVRDAAVEPLMAQRQVPPIDDLLAMTEPELYRAMQDALHAEYRAIASELPSFGHGVPDDAHTAVRIENARQRVLSVEYELRRRS